MQILQYIFIITFLSSTVRCLISHMADIVLANFFLELQAVDDKIEDQWIHDLTDGEESLWIIVQKYKLYCFIKL